MTPYKHIPVERRNLQRLIDLFNADEAFWRKLELRRKLRRKLLSGFSAEKLHELDLLDFARRRPPDDCVAPDAS